MKRIILLVALLWATLMAVPPVFAQGGIIGKMREVLKKVNDPDSGKKTEAIPEKGAGKEGEEKEKKDAGEDETSVPDVSQYENPNNFYFTVTTVKGVNDGIYTWIGDRNAPYKKKLEACLDYARTQGPHGADVIRVSCTPGISPGN